MSQEAPKLTPEQQKEWESANLEAELNSQLSVEEREDHGLSTSPAEILRQREAEKLTEE